MDKGVYCLIFENPSCTVRIGALGPVAFRNGWHIYVGSALGSGGLSRLERHITLARSKDRPPKWHVDYLSVSPFFRLRSAIAAATGERMECPLAGSLGGGSVPGFGSSDCTCPSHLFYRKGDPSNEVEAVFRSLHLEPVTKTIKNPDRRNGNV